VSARIQGGDKLRPYYILSPDNTVVQTDIHSENSVKSRISYAVGTRGDGQIKDPSSLRHQNAGTGGLVRPRPYR